MYYLLMWTGHGWVESDPKDLNVIMNNAKVLVEEGTPCMIVEDLEDLADMGIEL